MAAITKPADDGSIPKNLAESLKRFCRSIELCDDYLRGYYGLKLVSIRAFKQMLCSASDFPFR
jgi:ER membrane protein complex subunit 2